MNMDRDGSGEFPTVTVPMAMQLICAILGEAAKPVDRLAARCAASAGLKWSREVLDRRGPNPTTRAGWIAWKDLAKRDIRESDLHIGDPSALAAFLKYLTAIAGALALDGSLITRIDRLEIRRGLTVIGPMLDEPWREICAKARRRIDQGLPASD
ncbi:MAG: hypothetical protein EXS01_01490 [Phycisphaerales bacterium]|nr:hypothetical protein [Phycisphaerales bacterium]